MCPRCKTLKHTEMATPCRACDRPMLKCRRDNYVFHSDALPPDLQRYIDQTQTGALPDWPADLTVQEESVGV